MPPLWSREQMEMTVICPAHISVTITVLYSPIDVTLRMGAQVGSYSTHRDAVMFLLKLGWY
jgi:hypothetical protein